VRIEFVFEAILPAKLILQSADMIILLQIGIFSNAEGTHVSVRRNQCALESGACSTLFPRDY
jgi:hypothetical protein